MYVSKDTLSVKKAKISRQCYVLNLSDPPVVQSLQTPGACSQTLFKPTELHF